jgi:putative membrane protein
MNESVTSAASGGAITTELAARRTGMAFQRTRMSADNTLMSVMRTSLSLISFGFTIYQFFQKLKSQDVLNGSGNGHVRNFGTTLVALGIGMLILGIVYHLQFMMGLRQERKAMMAAGIVHGESKFPPSLTLITAMLLLVIGIMAILSMVFHFGPFD